jgi:hypothetical protein
MAGLSEASQDTTNTSAAAATAAPAAAPEDLAKPKMFGRLENVKVREYWKDEAQDFTPWLANEENLELLGETIGLSLELIGTEQRVGPFKADIVASDGEHTVIVENQLDSSDHKHLGQLLVYAAGRKAKTVVWVAKQVTDEYRKVMDWLNEETSTNFWALEIELWRIGNSPVAPKFNVVCEPNELTKPAPAASPGELSENKLLQLEFWKAMNEYFEEHGSSFNERKAQPAHWHSLPLGTSRARISLTALVSKNPRIGCELYIHHSQSDLIYEALEDDKEAIEQQLGVLEWQPLPDKKGARIAVYKQANIEDRDSWPELFSWLKTNAEKFQATFAQRVKSVQLPEGGDDVGSQGAASAPVADAAPIASSPIERSEA